MRDIYSINSNDTFFSYLERIFLQRQKSNPSYSIRAYARDLGVDQSLLSKFLRKKAEFNWKTVEQCLHRLSAPEEVFEYFKTLRHNFTSDFQLLEESAMNILGGWKYWAVIEFFKINPSPTYEIIAQRFGLDTTEAEDIVLTLIKLEFIEFQDGLYKILKPNNSWLNNTKTTQARRKLQRKFFELSLKSIDNVSVDLRHHCSLTVALDSGRIPEFKEKLNSLLIEFSKYSQKNSEINEVYQLTLGFFPLTVPESE